MTQPFATIILAGGRGTRMGSSDKHKVCFPVLGVPVIIRALETYTLCGAQLNVVVVGMFAESVMSTVSERFPGVAYAFQSQQLGTGDATRKGAQILERLNFMGDVLVVAGDKVIQPTAIRRLLETHRRSRADVSLATAKRPQNSSAGILLAESRGRILGILEEAERQRLVAICKLETSVNHHDLTRSQTEKELAPHFSEKIVRRVVDEAFGSSTSEKLTTSGMQQRFSSLERSGLVRVGEELFPAASLLERFNQMNLSTYLFRAPVLYDALAKLKPRRAGQEEYFTDVFEVLAAGRKPARVLGCEITNPHDLMAFNNPHELLAIEEVYRKQAAGAELTISKTAERILAPASRWQSMFDGPDAQARKQLREHYGQEVPWSALSHAVQAFSRRFGEKNAVAVIRSPGRINLMGRHIDHQGGSVNVMAIDREILLVAAPREDDRVVLANVDGSHFAEQSFRISDLVAELNWDDWQNVVDGPRVQRMLQEARGDWANYVKAAILRLQEQFRDRRLQGLNMMVSGQIPMGAGLSSSSALVVATAEAVRSFNALPVSARRLVSLCGEGEWFVGTRGGAADHAAIKLSKRGCVTRVSFFPFRIEDSAQFFSTHDLLVCNSGLYAGKSSSARDTFNAKVTAYHIGRAWFRSLRPEFAGLINHLRDLTPSTLSIAPTDFAKLLLQIPERLSRAQVLAAFSQFHTDDRARIEALFASHDAPARGYEVRGVVLFGLGEIERARRCLDFLNKRDATGLGKLMKISHDGDRVSTMARSGIWQRRSLAKPAGLPSSTPALKALSTLEHVPGAYGCSLPELDRIADLASALPGVEGAQLAGAGLGGCIMAVVRRDCSDQVRQALGEKAIRAEVFRPIAGAGHLFTG